MYSAATLERKKTEPDDLLSVPQRRLEDEVHLVGATGPDDDLPGLPPQLFMPSHERVIAGRQVADIEAAVLGSHGEVRVLEDGHVAPHPRVDVALYGDGDLLARERLLDGLHSRRLRLVPFAVVLRHG